MRKIIRKLGHIKTLVLVTLFAIIIAEVLTFLISKLFSFPYNTQSTPVIVFLVTLIITPLIAGYLIKLLIFLDQKEKKMFMLATYDSMTKLLRRQAFFKRSLALHDTLKKEEKSYFVAIVDIDHFKAINDSHGHAHGDEVLINFGSIMLTIFKDDYIIGRIGGEEFAIMMNADEETVQKQIDTLHRLVAAAKVPLKSGGHTQYTVSVGMFENKHPMPSVLIKHSHMRMMHFTMQKLQVGIKQLRRMLSLLSQNLSLLIYVLESKPQGITLHNFLTTSCVPCTRSGSLSTSSHLISSFI